MTMMISLVRKGASNLTQDVFRDLAEIHIEIGLAAYVEIVKSGMRPKVGAFSQQ